MYAVITQPHRYGRANWETFDTAKHAKYIAAFYRYTYGFVAEVWTINETPRGNLLGKCIKRDQPGPFHPVRQ
jgi:hypothetical protein